MWVAIRKNPRLHEYNHGQELLRMVKEKKRIQEFVISVQKEQLRRQREDHRVKQAEKDLHAIAPALDSPPGDHTKHLIPLTATLMTCYSFFYKY